MSLAKETKEIGDDDSFVLNRPDSRNQREPLIILGKSLKSLFASTTVFNSVVQNIEQRIQNITQNITQIISGDLAVGVKLNGFTIGGIKRVIEENDVLDIPELWEYNVFFYNFDVEGIVNCDGEINFI